MSATFKYNFCIFSLIFRKSFNGSFYKTISKFPVWVIIYFGDKFTDSNIYVYSMTAKVAVINDKCVQYSQTTVVSSLANF